MYRYILNFIQFITDISRIPNNNSKPALAFIKLAYFLISDTGWFGGHTLVRQGFRQYQVQGVEFYQLGQGRRIAHSPVNFFLGLMTPDDTFVKDCSVWESMTRWYELRGTRNVTLERNVGYKSIGHGYFLADGTETENTLRANIGIYARPAIDYSG